MNYLATLTAMASAAAISVLGTPVNAQPAGCPPGLEKKKTPCVPPGQAKNGVTADEWLTRHRIGERADPDTVDWIEDLARYDLPPLSNGRRYAVIDGMLVALDPDSYEILQLVRAATAVYK